LSIRDWLENSNEDEAKNYEQQLPEGEVLKFFEKTRTRSKTFATSPSHISKPDEYPSHRMLQELMSLDASGAETRPDY